MHNKILNLMIKYFCRNYKPPDEGVNLVRKQKSDKYRIFDRHSIENKKLNLPNDSDVSNTVFQTVFKTPV